MKHTSSLHLVDIKESSRTWAMNLGDEYFDSELSIVSNMKFIVAVGTKHNWTMRKMEKNPSQKLPERRSSYGSFKSIWLHPLWFAYYETCSISSSENWLLIYLKILRQCVRLKTSYSGFKGIISWVLQGSIASPFLLNTFFKSFLLLHFTSFCISIADDNKL